MAGAANEYFYFNPDCALGVRGFQWRNALHDRPPTLCSIPDPAVRGFGWFVV